MSRQLLSYVLAIGVAAAACGGAAPKVHDGYPEGEAEPWKKATPIKLNDAWQGAAETTINFPQRKRAKWYVIDIPADGKLTATAAVDGQSPGADVGFEVLDSGFNVRAQNTEDDEGQAKKTRNVDDNRSGKTYLHVWALKRTDIADVSVKISYAPTASASAPPPRVDPRGSFPYTVPNPPQLAMVGTDDAPKRGGGVRTPKPVAEPSEPAAPKAPTPEPIDPTSIRGSIVEFGNTAGGVKIIINKGNTVGVSAGWEGYVVSATTKRAMPKGGFKVKSVKNDECEAVVGLSLDDVQGNRAVVLKPPK